MMQVKVILNIAERSLDFLDFVRIVLGGFFWLLGWAGDGFFLVVCFTRHF